MNGVIKCFVKNISTLTEGIPKQIVWVSGSYNSESFPYLFLQDSIWGPAAAVNPQLSRQNPMAHQAFSDDSKASKKKKKSKMQKLDSSILGFTVHAGADRINVGEIDLSADAS